jgi:uncharacterized membrane protein
MEKINPMIELIEQQEWLDPIADKTEAVLGNVYGTETGEKARDLLHGTALGYPLHTRLNDIPIGAWTAAQVMDLLEMATGHREFARGADAAIAVGIGGAVLAAASGITDLSYTAGRIRRIGIVHALLNVAALLTYIMALLFGRSSRSMRRALAITAFAMLPFSAYLGSFLAYREPMATRHK